MPTVQILLAGTDVTAKVLFATAHFQAKVNGAAGTGYMRVRDDDSTFDFTIGSDWLVLVDGSAVWRGFAMQKKRVYIAPAMDVSQSGLQRFVDVLGPDGNILFDRRIVAKASSPATVEGTQFPAATADTTAITDLLANWLDLSADSIDTSGSVTHVGDLDPAQATRAWSGGWTWGSAMNTIAMLPGAIYYLRPESGSPHFTLVYCDVDTPTSPFGLSDQPNGTTTLGYRDMEITLDGTGLVTDELAWGYGYGSQTPVFKRVTDATALSTHGRWQDGRQQAGVYKQGTIDRIANSVVYGSPTNHRGAKDDRTAVELTTYEPGLLAGHVVAFTSAVWGFSDTIPVRQSDLSFDSPTAPKWRLVLSHAIDAPWGFYDQFWPQIPHYGPPKCPNPPCFVTVPPDPPKVACDCGITDTFTRTVAGGWGTSDSGSTWAIGTDNHGTPSVGSGVGSMSVDLNNNLQMDLSGFSTGPDYTVSLRFKMPLYSTVDMPGLDFFMFPPIPLSGYDAIRINFFGGGYLAEWWDGNASVTMAYTPDTWYRAKMERVAGVFQTKVWLESDPEPAWMTTGTQTTEIHAMEVFSVRGVNTGMFTAFSVDLDDLDISGVTRCAAVQFDDFNRTVASGLGTATPSGHVWTIEGHTGTYGDNGSAAYVTNGYMAAATTPVPEITNDFTMSGRFQSSYISTVSDSVNTVVGPFDVYDYGGGSGGFSSIEFWMTTVGSGSAYSGSVRLKNNAGTTYTTYKTDWVANAWYLFKWSTVNGWKLWKEGDAEPAWTGVGVGSFVRDKFRLHLNGSGTVQLDFIDFDYAGKPCYYDCAAPFVFDDFNRTVALFWGYATAGEPWGFTSTDGSTSVTPGSGLAVVNAGAPSSLIAAQTFAYTAAQYTSYRPWVYQNGWTCDYVFEASATNCEVRLVAFADSPSVVGMTFKLGLYGNFLDAEYNAGAAAPFTFAANTAYRLRVSVDWAAATWACKVWADGGTEPGWMLTGSIGATMTTEAVHFGLGFYNYAGTATTIKSHLIDFDWLTKPCDGTPVAPVPVGTPVGPTGFGCEAPKRSSSTVYTTAAPFTGGSTLVWRGGLYQRRGTDYSEGSDRQSIVFTTSVGSTEEVRVCYYAVAP